MGSYRAQFALLGLCDEALFKFASDFTEMLSTATTLIWSWKAALDFELALVEVVSLVETCWIFSTVSFSLAMGESNSVIPELYLKKTNK